MTSSMEPNAPPVNQRSACAAYRLRAAAVHGDPRMPTVEGVVADGGRDPPKSANGIGPSASPNAARWVQSRETRFLETSSARSP
jgi:hypothetical protein